ncbi:immunity protein Tsi6 family protein [Pseudomonas syringae]|uniref:immunity protein Tsi6 family protein n=1 Tax=Pseudomonas TaxID=286 RepID=UPI003983540B
MEHAVLLTEIRISRHPAFSIYAAVLNQPLYIKSILEVVEADKSGLHKLFIGALAVKRFKEKDYVLAQAPMNVYYIANQSANGLEIKLPEGLWHPLGINFIMVALCRKICNFLSWGRL